MQERSEVLCGISFQAEQSDVLGDDVQGYFAGITDEDQTLDTLDEGFKKLAEE